MAVGVWACFGGGEGGRALAPALAGTTNPLHIPLGACCALFALPTSAPRVPHLTPPAAAPTSPHTGPGHWRAGRRRRCPHAPHRGHPGHQPRGARPWPRPQGVLPHGHHRQEAGGGGQGREALQLHAGGSAMHAPRPRGNPCAGDQPGRGPGAHAGGCTCIMPPCLCSLVCRELCCLGSLPACRLAAPALLKPVSECDSRPTHPCQQLPPLQATAAPHTTRRISYVDALARTSDQPPSATTGSPSSTSQQKKASGPRVGGRSVERLPGADALACTCMPGWWRQSLALLMHQVPQCRES